MSEKHYQPHHSHLICTIHTGSTDITDTINVTVDSTQKKHGCRSKTNNEIKSSTCEHISYITHLFTHIHTYTHDEKPRCSIEHSRRDCMNMLSVSVRNM